MDKEVFSQVKREKKTVTFKLEPEFEGHKGSDSSEGHDTDNKEVWLVRLPNSMLTSHYNIFQKMHLNTLQLDNKFINISTYTTHLHITMPKKIMMPFISQVPKRDIALLNHKPFQSKLTKSRQDTSRLTKTQRMIKQIKEAKVRNKRPIQHYLPRI